MPAKIIDGRQLADRLNQQTKKLHQELHHKLGLVSIVIGDDQTSHKFANLKGDTAQKLGFHFEKKSFPDNFDPRLIDQYIKEKNSDKQIHGIVIQLPIPTYYHRHLFLKSIHPFKDVDCLHPKNLGLLIEGHPVFIPPVVLATLEIIRSTNKFPEKQLEYASSKTTIPDLTGADVTIVGAGLLVGKPLSAFLLNQNATATVCNEYTRDLAQHTHSAQIVITGTNQSNVLKPDDISDGTILIDIGHDLEPEKFMDKDIYLSKNPGGIGPLTIAFLLKNTLLSNNQESSNK